MFSRVGTHVHVPRRRGQRDYTSVQSVSDHSRHIILLVFENWLGGSGDSLQMYIFLYPLKTETR